MYVYTNKIQGGEEVKVKLSYQSEIRVTKGFIVIFLPNINDIYIYIQITTLYHSSATSPNPPRSRSPPESSIVIIVGRDSTNTWICLGCFTFFMKNRWE